MVGRKTILINNKEVPIRSYEVSIWTLQDSFITVLKWAGIDNKGQIQEPEMVIDIDGTQEFKFSIPMYLEPDKENPIWYNTLNGNLMIGMRKIKVILNKQLEDEAVFEFLITKVTERHEANGLFCDVECEGLAFHELGKIGYKISFSPDTFYLDDQLWFNGDQTGEQPRQTIQYWNEKTNFLLPYPENKNEIIPNKWYYKIEMNWERYGSSAGRENNKVYEDEYVSSWELNSNTHKLIPTSVESMREKERSIEISESNIYNITQKIAETFGVFCKYEYGYDSNYHIISRTVIYYNNFIEEEKGPMDLTYPYHTSQITREMDSSELVTKLFVRDSDYQYTDSGKVNIMTVDANKSREDYILNFDYLHKFNIISNEQYEAIEEYEALLHNKNMQLEQLQQKGLVLETKRIEYDAKATTAENGIDEAAKQQKNASDQVDTLGNGDDEDGMVELTSKAPKLLIVLTDETDNSLYVKMPFNGIVPETVRLYDGVIDRTKDDPLADASLISGNMEIDPELNELIKITHLPQRITKTKIVNEATVTETVNLNTTLWLVCTYKPTTYWKKVRDQWQARLAKITDAAQEYRSKANAIKEEIDALNQNIEALKEEKEQILSEFEEMMGPALREGYWQPEDYSDYGNKYLVNINQTSFKENNNILSYNLYDEQYYDDNNKITYQIGDETKTYLTIPLNEAHFNYFKQNYENLYFIYYDIQGLNQYFSLPANSVLEEQYLRSAKRLIHIGGDCRISFIKNNNDEYYPALIIEASKYMSTSQITFFQQGLQRDDTSNYRSKIGTITFDNSGNFTIDENAKIINFGEQNYLTDNIQEVYPRIIIDSLNLKATEDGLKIKFNDMILSKYTDYNVYIDIDKNDIEEAQHDKYIIDIKPMAYINAGMIDPTISIMYELSTAATFIYLDALQVAKENSEPKVSYTIDLNIYNPYVIHTIYKKLSKIVHINDIQLKFENVQGYISHIEMHLDTPWDDKIEIKNYKTKFEDLFSNIVAQTDAMQKKSPSYDTAAAAFTTDGGLTSSAVIKMLNDNEPLFKTYIDEKLTDNLVIRNTLKEVFNEAGSILGSAGSAISDIRALTSRNADILASFAEDATQGLTQVRVDESGIFMGSDQRISLFSGDISKVNSGVSIDLDPTRLILGASEGNDSTAAKFTKNYIVLAAGDVIADSETYENGIVKENLEETNVTGLINDLVGAKFTSKSIGLATLIDNKDSNDNIINTTINTVLMNDKGITLGSAIVKDENGTTINSGGLNLDQDTNSLRAHSIANASFVRISGTGIDIGSGGELYVDTQNFKINSQSINDNSIFELSQTVVDETTHESIYIPALKYSIGGGLEIFGRITANELKIYDPEFSGDDKYRFASDWVNAKVTPEEIWLKVKKATDPTQGADYQGTSLQLTDNMISIASTGTFNVNTANLIINSAATNTGSIFELKRLKPNSNNEYDTALKYSITDGLTIAGNLSADTGTIGGWNIGNNSLYSGEGSNYVALDSGTINEDYALWAGNTISSSADFRVKRNGKVYLHSLMVLDTRPISGGNWGLGGTDNQHEEVHVGVTADGEDQNLYYGYKAIDFSKLNFKQAVSVTGSWSGSTFDVNVSLWGVLNKQENLSASVSVSGYASVSSITGPYTLIGTLPITYSPGNTGGELSFELSCEGVYTNGYQAGEPMSMSEIANMGATASFEITRADSGTKRLTCSVQQTYNYAYSAGQNSMKLSRSGRTISVSSSGSSTSMSVSSGISMTVSGNTVTAVGYAYVDGTRVDSSTDSRTISSGSSGSGCFAAGTPVLLADNTTIPIEKLQLGMEVLGYDEETQSFKSTYVELLQHIHDRDLNIVDIYLSSGDIITMTEEHPLLTIDGWKALDLELAKSVYGVEASMLKIGDQFISANNTVIKVNQIIKRPDLSHTSVYHLDVEPYDTYVVKNIIAHNPGENSDK